MLNSNAHTIRAATLDDAALLRRLAELDSGRPIEGPALIGQLRDRPAAAISLADGRVVADPFLPTAGLVAHLRLRARALRAAEATPSLRARLRAGIRVRPAV